MKNLQLTHCLERTINMSDGDKGKLILDFWNDTNDNIVYFYTKDTINTYNFKDNSIDILYELKEIVGSEYLALKNELCAASKYGEVILVNPSTHSTEEVTFCEGGIKTMLWSPDQEIVVFITESNNIVVMTYTFDVVMESSLDDTEFGDQEFITVGWGKKETQFHGSEGKQAAQQKSKYIIPNNIDELDKTINITWRGDSELFAVSFVGKYGRIFKVFNKEGRLQFTSEKINDLGTSIAWKPSGSWIAIPHDLPNKYTIALFEKNGLRHRELMLPFKYSDEPVVNLSWSIDSDILCVETIKDNKSNIYLYTICNYHWYLKQTLRFYTKITNSIWDSSLNEDKTFHVLLEDGTYIKYKWIFTINYHDAIVAVIDGQNLLITDFQNNIIPPPMCGYKLIAPTFINSCGFLKNQENPENGNKIFIVTVDNFIIFYDLEYEIINSCKKLKTMNLLQKVEVLNFELDIPLCRNHWIWFTDETIVYCENKNKRSTLYFAQISNNNLISGSSINLTGLLSNITYINRDRVFCHTTRKLVYLLNISEGKRIDLPLPLSSINESVDKLKVIDINGTVKLISLQTDRNLCINNKKISSDVTSFFLTSKYLIFTLLNSIKFMKLSDDTIIDERKMERGGKIITIVSNTAQIILQMPRGNLEIITPRVLILDIIAKKLDNLDYGNAMDILRKHRINLNLIVDHNPIIFLENIDNFLEKITNSHWLNLFLSDLENEDFTKTLYSSNYDNDLNINNSYPDGYLIENKINYICEKMCKSMEIKNYYKFLLPLITTYVKRNNIEKALEIIWNKKKNENESIDDGGNNNNNIKKEVTSEGALKYLLYLVDVNELYNVALGMYDFGLVLFVASKSQKDPKEYVPFLNQLKNFEINYCKFKIDEYLKRYEKALEHITKCGMDKLNECLEFVQKHKLYQKALSIYEDTNLIASKKVAILFGDELRSNGKLEDASIMYERGDDLKQAILSAKHVLDWERCLMLTKSLSNNDENELKNISLSLVTALQEKGKYEDAWYLLKNHVGDFNSAMECLLDGRYYLKAIFEAKMMDVNLLESMVKPHLKNYAGILLLNLNNDMELYLKYKNRLQIVRKERIQRDINGICEDGIDECDLLSDTSSIKSSNYTSTSKGSGKTFRSSKNRRKHERKLLSLKERNPFEDIALIDALYNLIVKISGQQLHTRETCKALMAINSDKDGKEIQKTFTTLFCIIKDSLDEIWIPEIATVQQQLIGSSIDYAQLQNEQRYAMINPIKRNKPQLNLINWEFEILS